jgi:hypothetical protein
MSATTPATFMFLNLTVAAIAGFASVKILRGVTSEGRAGALGVVTHLVVAYLVNTSFWPPIPVPLASGLAAACAVALVIRAIAGKPPSKT